MLFLVYESASYIDLMVSVSDRLYFISMFEPMEV